MAKELLMLHSGADVTFNSCLMGVVPLSVRLLITVQVTHIPPLPLGDEQHPRTLIHKEHHHQMCFRNIIPGTEIQSGDWCTSPSLEQSGTEIKTRMLAIHEVTI